MTIKSYGLSTPLRQVSARRQMRQNRTTIHLLEACLENVNQCNLLSKQYFAQSETYQYGRVSSIDYIKHINRILLQYDVMLGKFADSIDYFVNSSVNVWASSGNKVSLNSLINLYALLSKEYRILKKEFDTFLCKNI